MHYIDPHGPYRPPHPWRGAFDHGSSRVPLEPERMHRYMVEPGVTDALDYIDAYDGEIAFTDGQVGRLLKGYGPRLADALVIFTADHGETMIEHARWFTHGYQVHEAIVRVPLLLRAPGVPAGRVSAPVHGTDVAPTILRFTGVEPPDVMSPMDLLATADLDPRRRMLVEATFKKRQWRGVIEGREKWTVQVRGPERRIEEKRRYDLRRDPGERHPGAWRNGEPGSAALLARVTSDPDPAGVPPEFEKGKAINAPKVAPRVDAETLEKLRTLGYAE